MTATEDYCPLCDLPRSQCIHGQPPPTPASKPASRPTSRATSRGTTGTTTGSATRAAPTPRKSATRTPGAPAKAPVTRRWTPPEVFKPLIVAVLQEAGGELETDELFLELEIAAEDRLLPGDRETTPEGELRWRYAARRARQSLLEEGVMARGGPGVWRLAPTGPPLG